MKLGNPLVRHKVNNSVKIELNQKTSCHPLSFHAPILQKGTPTIELIDLEGMELLPHNERDFHSYPVSIEKIFQLCYMVFVLTLCGPPQKNKP